MHIVLAVMMPFVGVCVIICAMVVVSISISMRVFMLVLMIGVIMICGGMGCQWLG